MLIKTLIVGQIETNCYIVTDENTLECAIIDPGDESNTILDYLEEHKLKPKYIFLTHGHFDHTMAVSAVYAETHATVCMNERDSHAVIENAPFRFNPPADTVWYSHTPGGVTLKCEDALFTGDTLFCGSCGRTDLEGGDMSVLLRSLKRLADLPGNYEVYPGHMDSTTLDRERRGNYYIKYAQEALS